MSDEPKHPTDAFCLHCRGGDTFDSLFCVTLPIGTSVKVVLDPKQPRPFTIKGTGPVGVPYDGRSPAEREFDFWHGTGRSDKPR